MNSPAGTSTIGTSSVPNGLIAAGVGNGVVVGVPGGGEGGEPGVAVGAACIASASGGSVGSLGAGGVTVGSLLTSRVGGATTGADVSWGLVGVNEASAMGADDGRVGDAGTVGEGTANRLGKIAITARTNTSARIRIKRVRGFFMATRFHCDVAVCELNGRSGRRAPPKTRRCPRFPPRPGSDVPGA
jgi:hypothetical protein